MDTMLNEGHYLGREGCLFRFGTVPEPGATRLATLAATQKSPLALSRLCGYAMLGQKVNSPQTGAKACSFLLERVHLKMLKIQGLRLGKKKNNNNNAQALKWLVYSKGCSESIQHLSTKALGHSHGDCLPGPRHHAWASQACFPGVSSPAILRPSVLFLPLPRLCLWCWSSTPLS